MKIFTSSAPKFSARCNPARNALYSAWLFEVGKERVRDNLIIFPYLFSRMMPTSLPINLETPSTKIVHQHAQSEGGGEVISAIKLESV